MEENKINMPPPPKELKNMPAPPPPRIQAEEKMENGEIQERHVEGEGAQEKQNEAKVEGDTVKEGARGWKKFVYWAGFCLSIVAMGLLIFLLVK